MKLLIDAGNTRIKWAFADGADWLRSGALHTGQAGELSQCLAGLPDVQQIWVSNVAGAGVARHIRDIGDALRLEPRFIAAQQAQCGVRNNYRNASQLGSDRWAALIAAWHLVGGDCLVVNSGTATTIDSLTAAGEFAGGLILPGVELMQHSLQEATAGLEAVQGEYAAFPQNTADAMYSGAIQACCGAIDRQRALSGDVDAPVVLSGGVAAQLQEHLNLPLRIVDNLVLQGLLLISREASEQ
jgi:type III pantothenate kinase